MFLCRVLASVLPVATAAVAWLSPGGRWVGRLSLQLEYSPEPPPLPLPQCRSFKLGDEGSQS